MKKTKRLLPVLLALMMGATIAMPLMACGDGDDNPDNGGKNNTNANVISASLLDGKVANLLSANGIAIQDKTQNEATVSAAKTKKARHIVASADETSTVEQPETELVKQTEDGLQDVHFHDGAEGDYTEWNEETHHHDGQVCEVEGCTEISDEILAAEEEVPTIISLDARVNKLYNSGKFTFLCVSSAVEGQVRLMTQLGRDPMSLAMQFFADNGAYLNTTDHYYSEEDRSLTVSYMNVQAGDKKGKILVRRSTAEEAYHYANYWSDDFNQSYIIDNETGKTYSLSSLPYIYSVQNGVIVTKTDTSETLYQPKIDENGELVLDEIEISKDLLASYGVSKYLTDIHGNILFTGRKIMPQGEAKEGGFIFTGLNEEDYQRLKNGRDNGVMKLSAYERANRYIIGNDGQIYRFDFDGDMTSVPVHVLNAQGEWVSVPKDAHVTFSDRDSFFAEISVNVARRQYMLISQIKGGKTYFVNATLGAELPFTMNTFATMYAEAGYFVGVSAMPTDGSQDTAMQNFMKQDVRAEQVLDNDSIVYRVGDTAFAYENKNTGEIVIWDRETETRKTIAGGEKIPNFIASVRIGFLEDRKQQAACFQVSTVNGTYYIGYDEKNPTKEWSEYSTTPFEKEEELDAYYELLRNKLKG